MRSLRLAPLSLGKRLLRLSCCMTATTPLHRHTRLPDLRDAFCHVAAYSRYVNLGFNRGAELSDPECIVQGSGKLIRHVRIASTAGVERPLVIALIREAAAGAPSGRDAMSKSLIIRSIARRKRRPANK
jgi:hypothetical protein